MPTDVLMPQMGESVAEGTVTKWLKKEGEQVGKDEPLFEISTEKVDAEIPSPVAGVLAKILVSEGQTVAVRAVVAQIEPAAGEAAPEKEAAPVAREKGAPAPPTEEAPKKEEKEEPEAAKKEAPKEAARPSTLKEVAGAEKKEEAPEKAPPAVPKAEPEKEEAPAETPAEPKAEREEEGAHVRTSPLVRRMAKEQGVDLAQVEGTGPGGRITKEDLLAHLEKKGQPRAADKPTAETKPAAEPAPAPAPGAREEIVPMTAIRKKIAEHMVLSRRTSAHVTTVFQLDLARVWDAYHKERERFDRQENTRLSYTPFFVRAVMDGLKRFPVLNSSVSGDNIVLKKDVHMGIAVATEAGLIVPVIHHADEKSFLGLTRAINDLAERARNKKLNVADVQGGTFTITNYGIFGSLFGTPIISQPQVGIVGIGAIHKAAVVINDAIAIRPIVNLSLSYDHRIIDGAIADQFMAAVKRYLEEWDEDLLG